MSSTTDCVIQGNADVYGLGIRVGFYSQWYGTILADWLAPSEVPGLRNSNASFLVATLIAVIILSNDLEAAEVYTVLVLFFGSTFYTLLVVYWRVLTCLSDRWDPTRFTGAKPRGKMSSFLWSLLSIAELAFMLWFWIVRIPSMDSGSCTYYGFMFFKIPLNSDGLRLFHIVFVSLTMAVVLPMLMLSIYFWYKEWRDEKNPVQVAIIEKPDPAPRRPLLHALNGILRLCVATTINTAVESSIAWNNIQGVHDMSSAGQLIPAIIGIGTVVRVVYKFLLAVKKGDGGVGGDGMKKKLRDQPVHLNSYYDIPESGALVPVRMEFKPQGDANI